MNRKAYQSQIWVPALLSLIMIICHWIQWNDWANLNQTFGVYPRTWRGLSGILFSPFLHGDFQHLINNLWSFAFLTWALFHSYPKIATKVLGFGWLTVGAWTWVIAQGGYHIGASGIIYFLAVFIFLAGLIGKTKKHLALSLVVCFLHAGLIWGALPIESLFKNDLWKLSPEHLKQIQRMSWEGHLSGLLTGIVYAFYFKKELKPIEKKPVDESIEIAKMEEKYGKYFWDPEKRENYVSNSSEPIQIVYYFRPKKEEE